ncbi:MAG: hypothetical protein KDN20_23260 [Verrucomicrobiae bacterium]|nr:hypothetical protein [Verrucomicrobiae bacterium]
MRISLFIVHLLVLGVIFISNGEDQVRPELGDVRGKDDRMIVQHYEAAHGSPREARLVFLREFGPKAPLVVMVKIGGRDLGKRILTAQETEQISKMLLWYRDRADDESIDDSRENSVSDYQQNFEIVWIHEGETVAKEKYKDDALPEGAKFLTFSAIIRRFAGGLTDPNATR